MTRHSLYNVRSSAQSSYVMIHLLVIRGTPSSTAPPGRAASGAQQSGRLAPGRLAATQTALDPTPPLTPQLEAQRYIDSLSVFDKAVILTIFDQFNLVRSELSPPLGVSEDRRGDRRAAVRRVSDVSDRGLSAAGLLGRSTCPTNPASIDSVVFARQWGQFQVCGCLGGPPIVLLSGPPGVPRYATSTYATSVAGAGIGWPSSRRKATC